MNVYAVILHPQAWQRLAATQGAERRRLLGVLEQVAANPFRAGDLQLRDQSGRINEVAMLGEWLLTYWSDHASREIRIVSLERVDDGP